MQFNSSVSIVILLTAGFFVAASVCSPRGAMADIESVRAAAPPELRDRDNPLVASPEDLARAGAFYAQNCVLCHGPNGDGRGPASSSLRPRPMNFSDPELMSKVKDGELFFAISSGSHGTAMPPFGKLLEEKDVWHLVAYLRTFSQKSDAKAE